MVQLACQQGLAALTLPAASAHAEIGEHAVAVYKIWDLALSLLTAFTLSGFQALQYQPAAVRLLSTGSCSEPTLVSSVRLL